MCFLYRLGSSLTISSAILPSSIMCTSLSISACKSAPGMSVTTTYLPSFVSIVHDSIIASRDMVGKLTSSFVVYCRCGLLSAHPLALIVTSCFSFKNMRYHSAFSLSSYVRFSFITGNNAFLWCSCCNSLSIASFPFTLNANSLSLMFI